MPRKSGVSEDDRRESLGVEDLSLPRTMIQRLAKGVLPPNTQIQKDALLALSKSATVFVNYLASNASEVTAAAGKKTINPQDVFTALKELEFEAFLPRVQAEVQKYNDIQCDKRNSYRRKIKEEKAAADDTPRDEEPPSKKVRRDSDAEEEDAEDEVEEDVEDEDIEDEPEDEPETTETMDTAVEDVVEDVDKEHPPSEDEALDDSGSE